MVATIKTKARKNTIMMKKKSPAKRRTIWRANDAVGIQAMILMFADSSVISGVPNVAIGGKAHIPSKVSIKFMLL